MSSELPAAVWRLRTSHAKGYPQARSRDPRIEGIQSQITVAQRHARIAISCVNSIPGHGILLAPAFRPEHPRKSPSRAPTPLPNMSLVNLAHVCSHLQNASKARLALTSIPVSKMHVKLMLGLQREGFLSSVTLGGPTPPKPYLLQAQPTPENVSKVAEKLAEKPWLAYPTALTKTAGGEEEEIETASPFAKPGDVYEVHVPQNPAKRRLWLGLKYWNNEPVLKHMKLVSKPTRRIWLTSEDLGKITRTRPSSYVQGLTHPGECMFITTDRGILEARECVERRIGGMALCRVW
ncbi:ribosomal protein S8 [Sporormia fimetaria CBS 119925]|uniref:Ribosomal protein S8 n=1 Tax=Sporormia fimetaria CBS 119925 TaxID=1340428 RepID=A0A6A6VS40_9PLEO|nr:ribosomal protein S8 [Sporormia fimetaria CBS 119925]